MCKRRLDEARNQIVDAVEEAADDRGIPVTTASNIAYDTATQDETLLSLCDLVDDLQRVERRQGQADAVANNVLDAGISLDDAIRARREELVEEVLDDAEAVAIEEVEA